MQKPTLRLILAALLPASAWSAGGHYPVDDADVVTPGEFQIETWYSHFGNRNNEVGFLSAITVFDQLEVTAGHYRLESAGEDVNRFEPAAKWQFDLIGQLYRESSAENAEAQISFRTGVGGVVEHLDIALGQNPGSDGDRCVTAGVAPTF